MMADPELAQRKYDVVVVGGGLAGLTCANGLARYGRSVLLLEQHFQLGGLAAWFRRPGGFIFDISLHGFPVGMMKSCRRYWNRDIADSIVPLRRIRFENPQFRFETTFDRTDFTRHLIENFGVVPETVEQFFTHLRRMNFYDEDSQTVGQLFETFFPGRADVHRLLLEPISYANGSSMEDPAVAYGIVFSNFMNRGVFTFRGGTDQLIRRMEEELRKNGVVVARNTLVDKVYVDKQAEGYG
ncbi:MAG: FAD-dependent oxidoreductase, partial [Puniceicoccales bacterium]|nr:FAD-dependent oxidoreductase [Puniceicoccales bacterium]